MRRDVRTDWTVRDDVRAKLRSFIKRLLVKYGYQPDTQPGAIKPVKGQMGQMGQKGQKGQKGQVEQVTPRHSAERSAGQVRVGRSRWLRLGSMATWAALTHSRRSRSRSRRSALLAPLFSAMRRNAVST